MLSHFSTTRKVSVPHFVWNASAFSASTAAPYSMQPFSLWTFGTLARKCCRTSARLPGLAVMTAMTWIKGFSPGDELGRLPQLAKDDRVLLEELAERLRIRAIDADDEEGRLRPPAARIASLAPEMRIASRGDEVLQRGVGDAVLHVGSRLAARVRRRDECRGGCPFRGDQRIDLRIALADAHHHVRIGKHDIFRTSIGLEEFRRQGHAEKLPWRREGSWTLARQRCSSPPPSVARISMRRRATWQQPMPWRAAWTSSATLAARPVREW